MILNWQKLKGEERDSAWEALEEWVWWLRSTYLEARETVVDCWPAHADLVQELTAVYVWWEDMYEPLSDEVPDPDTDKLPAGLGDEATDAPRLPGTRRSITPFRAGLSERGPCRGVAQAARPDDDLCRRLPARASSRSG